MISATNEMSHQMRCDMASENELLAPAAGHVDLATGPVARAAATMPNWQWREFRQGAVALLLNIP